MIYLVIQSEFNEFRLLIREPLQDWGLIGNKCFPSNRELEPNLDDASNDNFLTKAQNGTKNIFRDWQLFIADQPLSHAAAQQKPNSQGPNRMQSSRLMVCTPAD